MSELDRLRWRCRRGLMELEIILDRFVSAHYAQLSAAERAAFGDLLACPDESLWALVGEGGIKDISGLTAEEDPLKSRLLSLLRQC